MTQRYRGIVEFFNNGWGFINSQNKDIERVFVFWTDIKMEGFKSLQPNQTVEFSIKRNEKGLQATNVTLIERNIVKHHTEDKFAWCKEGERLEEAFVKNIVPKINRKLKIHPDKKNDPTTIDLYNIETKQKADLKTQNTPFFTSSRYGYDPKYTVTFNRKDYERYKKLYPEVIIYWYVNWQQLIWKTIKVTPLEGVWEIPFSIMARYIENNKVPLHTYLNRINDDINAKDSYLFDLRTFNRLM
ncbi:cold shock domain-containing protein [Halalkalibacterium halodurans]|uniref:cold shock domain-containing protein n=1 Tax=Halalkalibacterium halodurans TaxID=86665 RepID=UPI002AA9AE99|nr:cold shock domain-containing protein [Halalkalibacterium halodurans]MDY7224513.1 cold shock domain-containing protein [Halalkalibacterium halodurans]MDY7243798.1 cold shock domain-containing protein [Halalkalibacterium halodurans]